MRSSTLLLAASVALGSCATAPAPLATARVGSPLALKLPDLEGRDSNVAADAAGKVLLLDFWASWCEPCRDAMPAIDRIYVKHRERGLVVVGVTVDADQHKIGPFLEVTKVSFPILWDKGAAYSEAAFRLARIPTVLLVDRRGLIRHVHEGYTGDDEAARIEEEVVALLAEPP